MKENKAIKSVLNKVKAQQDSGNFMDKFNVEVLRYRMLSIVRSADRK